MAVELKILLGSIQETTCPKSKVFVLSHFLTMIFTSFDWNGETMEVKRLSVMKKNVVNSP